MLLLTTEEMRALDRLTIESGHASGETLMERAGAGVVRMMERHYGPILGFRVAVLCGTGNNGGDGFVAARHLKSRGADVHVAVVGDRSRVRGDARLHLERLETEGVTATAADDEDRLRSFIGARDSWDFALDALLGTGARGSPEGIVRVGVQVLRELDEAGTRIVAVDLPTGVDADTGAIGRPVVRADLTVTFAAAKRGHFLYPGRSHVGILEVVDIGLLAPDPERGGAVQLATELEMAELVPRRDPRAHKGSVGRVLVVGGTHGLTGAVTLAARAATRTGAGYVQAAVPASVSTVLAIKLTEEMTLGAPETERGTLARSTWEMLRPTAARVDVLAIGSGLSRDPESAEVARRIAHESERPLVIDADGLNAFEAHHEELRAIRVGRVLTPHLGEMSRLTGLDADALEARRIDAAREWAERWNAVVVLKGAPTITAAPDLRATLNPTGNPGMATAGMGDVLTGVIAALIGQGLGPYDAARLGVYIHGLAGDLAAEVQGPLGLCASDAIDMLPYALRRLVQLRDAKPE